MFRGRRRDQRRATATAEVVRPSARPVVVTALGLKAPAREHLARSLGDVEIKDIREDVVAADVVLAPSCSPQAIATLKRAFPTARVVVVELDDGEWDVHFAGPVQRLMAAGADAYLTADSIVDLAGQLRAGTPQAVADDQLAALSTPSVDDLIMANVADLLQRRAEAATTAGGNADP